MTTALTQKKLLRANDWLAVALAASLPWSTSATGILAALWLVSMIPTLNMRALREIITMPAGGLPVLLVLLGAAGMLWADVTWAERWDGMDSYLKLLFMPLLFMQFRRSECGLWVFAGFLLSCVVLLVVSTLGEFVPGFSFIPMHGRQVLVKNAPSQSGEFVTCVFGLLYLAVDCLERRRWWWLLALSALMLGFLANIFYVATGRTALVTILALLVLFAARRLRPRGVVILASAAVAIVVFAWISSSYLRDRTWQLWTDYQKYETTGDQNSSGERLEFWKKSIAFIREAPVIGHGTGSIHSLFITSSEGKTGAAGSATTNPHNQTFAVGIQIGIVGIVILWAMWIAHFLLFRGGGLPEWIGILVVAQNIVGSLFNSHLFDFLQGWIYVVGAGVAGGMALKNRAASKSPAAVS